MSAHPIRTQHDSADPATIRADALVRGILTMLEPLSPLEKQAIVQRLNEALRPMPVPAANAGDILGVVIKLIPRKGEWTVDDLKRTIEGAGVEAEPKQIYNALGYLTRRNRIRRVGYGRYIVDGVAIETPEDLGPDTRYEESYTENLR